MAVVPTGNLTSMGTLESIVVLFPGKTSPQHWAVSLGRRTHAPWEPTDKATALGHVRTTRGVRTRTVVSAMPIPNSPMVFAPQHLTVPSGFSAHVNSKPIPTEDTPERSSTSTGVAEKKRGKEPKGTAVFPSCAASL